MERLVLLADRNRSLRVVPVPGEPGAFDFLEMDDPADIRNFLRPLSLDPGAMAELRKMLADEGSTLEGVRLTDEQVVEQIAWRVRLGRFAIARELPRQLNPFTAFDDTKPDEPPEPPPKPAPVKKLTWIELRVINDETGDPVGWARVVVKDTSGEENFYTTDADGLIRIENLEPGTCDARCDIKDARRSDTLRFVAMGEKTDKKQADKPTPLKKGVTYRILNVDDHKVATGETMASLAGTAGCSESDLDKFNFDTDDPDGVNTQLGLVVGCTKKDASGKFLLDSSDKPGIVLLHKKWEQTGLATEKRHTIRIKPIPEVRREWIIEMEELHFHHDSAVLLADYLNDDPDPKFPPDEHVTSITVLAEALVEATRHPQRKMLISGHTDTSGSAEYNLPLSDLRAKVVLAALTGDRDGWVDLVQQKKKVEDHQLILKWVAADRGWPCDPGKVDNADGPKTQAAVKGFQQQYNIEFGKAIGEDGIMGPETWGAIFDVYMDKLKEITDTDDSGLSDLRSNVKFVDDSKKSVGCGENFPKEKRGVDGFRSRENRRVEILFFEPDMLPNLSCHAGGKCTAGLCQVHDPTVFIPTVIPVPTKPALPKPTIKFVKIQTSDPVKPPAAAVYHEDDDFSPRLGEKIKFHVEITNLPAGFKGKVQVDAGRLTNRPAGANPDKNEAFTLCGKVEVDVAAGADPLKVEVEWDGKATAAVPQEYSNRTTTNNNGGATVNIPLNSIGNGAELIHGLYVVDQVSLLNDKGKMVAKDRPADVDFSVPHLCNLQFNGNWPTDLAAYGLSPFQSELEEALRRFGGRDYLIRNATLSNRINVRFISDAGVTNSQSVRLTIGGAKSNGLFGSTPDGPAPLADNIYAFFEGLGADVDIFPGTFMLFNQAANAIGPNDQADFRATFAPLGVAAGASAAAIGVATPRSVSASGAVTGAADNTDKSNITLTFDDDGMATVVSTDPTKVPAARATDLQRALRRFVLMVGNTTNHEAAHAFGIASRVRANNKLTIGGVTVTSPLDGDGGAHNKVTSNTNIVDAGGTRAFSRRVETTGVTQKFSAINTQYFQDCIPFDRKDN